jgi:hypothetical protein
VIRGLAAAALALALAGCGYQIGFKPVADLSEVAVPIFENKTLRRGYEHTLTAEVRRVILETTPLHLGREGSSRAILRGTITNVTESVVIPGITIDEVVEANLSITISVEVVERGTNKLLVGRDTDGDGRPDGPIVLTDSQNYVTSLGQTRDTASALVLRDLAERTAQLLEERWGGAQGK